MNSKVMFIGSLDKKYAFLVNYNGQTDRPVNQPTNLLTDQPTY